MGAKMSDRNAFVVVVDESWYQWFVPFYIHFCQRTYPTAEIFIFICGRLLPAVREQLDLSSTMIHIVENHESDMVKTPQNVKTSRWTILADQLPGIQYAYIGDIDIFVAKETENLFENHKLHAQTIGAPFSNVIRPGSARLTGPHFIDVLPYTQAVGEGVKKLRAMLKNPIKIRNEVLLYNLVKDSGILPKSLGWVCGVGGPQTTIYRPMHGVHLGQFRGENKVYTSASKEEEQMYFKDFVLAFEENRELTGLMKSAHERVLQTIFRALDYGRNYGDRKCH